MFGFVRPVKPELRVREVERFQCVYCGLCHAIRQRYGGFHTYFLSYDMTFLALLLESLREEDSGVVRRRCAASPVRRKAVLKTDGALERAADLSVLLTCLKMDDSVADERGLRRAAARGLRWAASPGYRAAGARLPAERQEMERCLADLAEAEAGRVPSIDRAADPFARMLQACVPVDGGTVGRALRELLYHMGRWIYLIDACADLQEDWKAGGYNPVALRYEMQTPELTPIRDALELTLARSLAAVHAAFVLLPVQRDRELLENIICLGMPAVTRQVLDGTYQSNGGRNRHGSL